MPRALSKLADVHCCKPFAGDAFAVDTGAAGAVDAAVRGNATGVFTAYDYLLELLTSTRPAHAPTEPSDPNAVSVHYITTSPHSHPPIYLVLLSSSSQQTATFITLHLSALPPLAC